MLSVLGLVAAYADCALATPVLWAGNGHYYEYVPTRLNWSAALADANSRSHASLQGYLATITSSGEQAFVASLLINAEWGAWLAGSDAALEGTWTWVAGPEQGQTFWQGNQTGATVGGAFEAWPPTEPNNLNNEDSLAIWGPNGAAGATSWGEWNDFQSSDTQGFVVEYSTVPEPSTMVLAACAAALMIAVRRRR